MDWIQWYAAGLAAILVLLDVFRLSEQEIKPGFVLLGWALLAPIFGRVLGWW
jgi:hypothetical protein